MPSGANLPDDLHEIAFLVVNRMVHANLAQIFLLCRARRAENHQSLRARELHGGDSHASRRAMDQNAVARQQIAHREHGMMRRQIIRGNRGAVVERHPGGQSIYRARGNRDPFRIRVEVRQRHDGVARLQSVAIVSPRALDYLFHHARDLEAWDERRLGSIGIESHTLEQICEIDANGLDADQHFPGLRLGVGDLAGLKNLRRAIPPYDQGAHLTLLAAENSAGVCRAWTARPERNTCTARHFISESSSILS